jgi:hypothetical protein
MRTLFLLAFAAALAALNPADRWRVLRIAGQIVPESQNATGTRHWMAGVCTCCAGSIEARKAVRVFPVGVAILYGRRRNGQTRQGRE